MGGYRTKQHIEAHDAAGFDDTLVDLEASYDDGYGNNVAHGDRSMQRLVESGIREGVRDPDVNPLPVTAYDKHPFQSKAQARYMRSAEARGEVPAGTSHKWATETAGGVRSLPERKR